MHTLRNRIKALSRYLQIPRGDISCDTDDDDADFTSVTFTVTEDGKTSEYLVLTNEEADARYEERLAEEAEYRVDDFYGDDEAVIHALNTEWFEDCCREVQEDYVSEMDDDEVIQECIEASLIDEDEDVNEEGEYIGDSDLDSLRDELVDYKYDDIDSSYYGDFIEWYVDSFGSKELESLVRSGQVYVDMDDVADFVRDEYYSREDLISTDQVEGEYGDFFIYKIW